MDVQKTNALGWNMMEPFHPIPFHPILQFSIPQFEVYPMKWVFIIKNYYFAPIFMLFVLLPCTELRLSHVSSSSLTFHLLLDFVTCVLLFFITASKNLINCFHASFFFMRDSIPLFLVVIFHCNDVVLWKHLGGCFLHIYCSIFF